MALYNYTFASGWNVADGSLINPEDRVEFAVRGRSLPPRTTPPDFYPVRTLSLSGREFGDGRFDVVWSWSVLERSALAYIITAFSLTSATNAQATIRTRLHETAAYARYNCYLLRPRPNEDYEYRQGVYLNVAIRFTGLVAL